MTHRYYRKWRRVSLLSATFLFATFLSLSCKKKESVIGSNAYDPTELLNAGAVDTFTLNTYTIIQDSVFTKNRLLNVLGEMNDPVFGKVNASFYTQIRLASVNPNFDDITQISIDSFVLALRFADYTGNPSTQTFEVYELNDDISSDTAVKYYDFDTITIKQPNLLMPGRGTFKPDPIGDAIVDTVAVAPQMRLSLDTNLARAFMVEAANSGGAFASNENFVNYFKGFKINVNNPTQAPGQGTVFSFDMRSASSKLTIYYKQMQLVGGVMTPVRKTYDFVINSNCQSFNHVEFERAGTKVQLAENNKALGAIEFYAQSFGLQAVLEIPGLSNLPKTAVVHRAVLDLPIQYQTGSNFNTGIQLFLFSKKATDSRSIRPLYNPTISDITKSVTVNMRGYIQDVVAGKVANEPIYITPFRDNYSMDRIIFNGSNTINKVKPKLYIIYTEF